MHSELHQTGDALVMSFRFRPPETACRAARGGGLRLGLGLGLKLRLSAAATAATAAALPPPLPHRRPPPARRRPQPAPAGTASRCRRPGPVRSALTDWLTDRLQVRIRSSCARRREAQPGRAEAQALPGLKSLGL